MPALQSFVSRLFLAAAVMSAALLSGCGKRPDDQHKMLPALPVMRVAAGQATIPSDYAVRLQGEADAEIRPQVDGVLQAILVREGDHVSKGQPLFRIDDSSWREQYQTAVAARHAAEAQASVARVNADKLVPLVDNKVVAPIQLTTARAQEKAARAQAEQAAAQARAARINLDYTVVRAPVSGFVGRIPFRQGNLLTRNQAQALTTISDVGRIYAEFSISESEFARFKSLYPGRTLNEKIAAVPPVRLTLSDGSVYAHSGKLESVSGDFDQATGSIGLRAVFSNGDGLLRSGNSGTVSLFASYSGVVFVPVTATVDLQDKLFVFVLQPGNKVKKQVLTVSGKLGQNFIVTGGIRPGDAIVLAGIDKLKDGATVKPVLQAGAGAPPPNSPAPVNAR